MFLRSSTPALTSFFISAEIALPSIIFAVIYLLSALRFPDEETLCVLSKGRCARSTIISLVENWSLAASRVTGVTRLAKWTDCWLAIQGVIALPLGDEGRVAPPIVEFELHVAVDELVAKAGANKLTLVEKANAVEHIERQPTDAA